MRGIDPVVEGSPEIQHPEEEQEQNGQDQGELDQGDAALVSPTTS
jgi:hypothetical protein